MNHYPITHYLAAPTTDRPSDAPRTDRRDLPHRRDTDQYGDRRGISGNPASHTVRHGIAWLRRCTAAVLTAGLLLGTAACGASNQSADNLPQPRTSRIGMTENEIQGENYDRLKYISSLTQMKRQSDVVAAGIVTGTQTASDPTAQMPVGLSTFHVLASAKGPVKPGQSMIVMSDSVPQKYDETYSLKKGEVVLLFLCRSGWKDTNKPENESEATRATAAKLKKSYMIDDTYVGIYMLKDMNDYQKLLSAADGKGSADDVPFSRFVKSFGDRLPTTITLRQVKAA